MELQYGVKVENKSLLLLKLMLDKNPQLNSRLSTLGLLGVAMGDKRYKQFFKRESSTPLYLIFDKKVNFKDFKEFLRFIREDYSYLNDYPFEFKMEDSRKHIVVLEITEELNKYYSELQKSVNSEEFKEYLL